MSHQGMRRCGNGHALSGENLVTDRIGRPCCRQCRRDAGQRGRESKSRNDAVWRIQSGSRKRKPSLPVRTAFDAYPALLAECQRELAAWMARTELPGASRARTNRARKAFGGTPRVGRSAGAAA